jgi:hypothetical protein
MPQAAETQSSDARGTRMSPDAIAKIGKHGLVSSGLMPLALEVAPKFLNTAPHLCRDRLKRRQCANRIEDVIAGWHAIQLAFLVVPFLVAVDVVKQLRQADARMAQTRFQESSNDQEFLASGVAEIATCAWATHFRASHWNLVGTVPPTTRLALGVWRAIAGHSRKH